MQLDDRDGELFKSWLVKKLGTVSEVESDVLADYIVALLKGDGSETITKTHCIANLKDFLAEHTAPIVEDIFTVLKTKAYDPSKAKRKQTNGITRHDHVQPKKRRLDAQDDRFSRFGSSERTRHGNVRHSDQRQPGRSGDDTPMYFPPIDPNDPLAAIVAMRQQLGLPMPPIEPMQWNTQAANGTRRCKDYETKGYCVRGAGCPYSHGPQPLVVLDHNAENGATLTKTASGQKYRFQRRPNRRPSKTKIAVSRIPPDYLNEAAVRDFYAAFGTIDKISLNLRRSLAVITYTREQSARAALESSLPVFNNRFVRVAPYYELHPDIGKHNTADGPADSGDEPMQDGDDLDLDEVRTRQEEAQRKHEERRRQREEAANHRLEISRKLEQVERERWRIIDTLTSKTGEPVTGTHEQTEQAIALRAQLAQLEAEAIRMGIDPSTTTAANGLTSSKTKLRGSARAFIGLPNSLDNRPTTVAIEFEEGDYQTHKEALRQHLLFNGADSTAVQAHPTIEGAAVIEFPKRWHAEAWMDAAHAGKIPNVGKLLLSWYNPNAPAKENGREENDSKGKMEMNATASDTEQPMMRDLDTYDEDNDA